MALLAPGHQSRYIDARQHAPPVLHHVVEDQPSTERHPHRHVLPEQPVEILRGDVGLEHRAQEVAAHGVGALTQQALDESRCPREVHDRTDLRRIRLREPRHERAHAGLVDQHQRRDAVGAVQIDRCDRSYRTIAHTGPTALHAGDGIEPSPIRHCVERLMSTHPHHIHDREKVTVECTRPQAARTAGWPSCSGRIERKRAQQRASRACRMRFRPMEHRRHRVDVRRGWA